MGERIKKAIVGNKPLWVLTIVAIVLGCAGFVVPPTGVIDPSVLKYTAELIGLGALWCFYAAIVSGGDAKLQHGNTSVTLTSKRKKDETVPEL